MPTLTIEYADDAERLALEQAIALATELRRLTATAPGGARAGGGAGWIRNLAAEQFPGAAGALDIYHAGEQIAGASKRAFGGAAEATRQREAGRWRLRADGSWGLTEWGGEVSGQLPAGGGGVALGGLNCLAGDQGRLGSAARLRRGQAIGSGLVGGAIKRLVSRRLKQAGARRKTGPVGRWMELGALAESPEWDAFWCAN